MLSGHELQHGVLLMTPEEKLERDMMLADIEFLSARVVALSGNVNEKLANENRKLRLLFEDIETSMRKIRRVIDEMDPKVP